MSVTVQKFRPEPDKTRQCDGKVRYGRQETADKAMLAMRKKGRELEAYPCPHCEGFHLGHSNEGLVIVIK